MLCLCLCWNIASLKKYIFSVNIWMTVITHQMKWLKHTENCTWSNGNNQSRKYLMNDWLHNEWLCCRACCMHTCTLVIWLDIIVSPVFEAWLILCSIWKPLCWSWRLMLPALFPACGTCSCSHSALLQRVHSRVRYWPNRSANNSDWPRSNHWTEWGQRRLTLSAAPLVSSFSGFPSLRELKDTHTHTHCSYHTWSDVATLDVKDLGAGLY